MRRIFNFSLCLVLCLSFLTIGHTQEIRRSGMLLASAGPPSSGLKFFMDPAAFGLSDNDAIATATDSSGQGNHATQSNGAKRPTFKTGIINGLPVVRFVSSVEAVLELPNIFTGLTAGDGLILCKNSDLASQSGLWKFGSDGASDHVPYVDGIIYDGFASTVRKSAGDPTQDLGSWTLYEVSSSSGEWTVRINNSVLYTTGSNAVGWTTAPTIGRSAGVQWGGGRHSPCLDL